MNGRLAKKIRRVAHRESLDFMIKTKDYINKLPFLGRIKLAWRILWRDF